MRYAPTLFFVAAMSLAGFSATAVEAHDLHARSTAGQPVWTASTGLPSIPGFGGPFRLTDHTGRMRTDKDFRGRLMLVTFGFTECAEVCPLEMQAVAEALDRLGALADEVAPLLITVDPRRDTPMKLAAFVGAFHPSIIGLTGSDRDVADVIRRYRVHVMAAAPGGAGEVGHSSFMYLMGRDGGFLGLIPPDAGSEAIAARIVKYAR